MITADIIKKAIPEKGTLSVNRNLHLFHPLTGHLPPSNQMTSLSSLVVRADYSVSRVKEELMGCAPDVILITLLDDWSTGNSNTQLLSAIQEVGIYEEIVEIPLIDDNLGEPIDFVIFRKTKETACLAS
ncbi:hypothetical protein FACS189475_06180 [Betaproteobacteria bacterium]|nr:hypothetical protein FACS189475_06180 [Betaproteobacteria bacterium]